jgi:hypothetical protein
MRRLLSPALMNTFIYFAYGSNMLTERLRARCPSVRVIGPAVVSGFDLKFFKRSVDQSGKAMLSQTERPGRKVVGVLSEIAMADLGALDEAEGEGSGYDRLNRFTVLLPSGGTHTEATTYLAADTFVEAGLQPYDWYLALVIAGAREHGLPSSYIGKLAATRSIIDEDRQRETRTEAIRILGRAGFADYRRTLEDTQQTRGPHASH